MVRRPRGGTVDVVPLTFSGFMRNSGTCDRSLSNSCCVRGRAVDKSSTTLVSARGASRSSSRKRAMEQQTSCRCQPCGEGAQELEEVPDSVDTTTRWWQSSMMILNRSALQLRTNGQIQREIINSRQSSSITLSVNVKLFLICNWINTRDRNYFYQLITLTFQGIEYQSP